MLDDIGLGSAIANVMYLILIGCGLILFMHFFKKKEKIKSFFSISVFANLLFYLYFMGKYFFYPKYLYLIINNYWPIINGALLAWLIWDYYRNKNKK